MRLDGRRRARSVTGVTLIELMVVVAVIALLAAVAFPAYQGSVRKARRAEAKAALTTAAQLLERYYTENGRYNANVTTAVALVQGVSAGSYYTLDLPTGTLTANAYVATATPRGAQADDGCGTFTIDQNGSRGVANAALGRDECW